MSRFFFFFFQSPADCFRTGRRNSVCVWLVRVPPQCRWDVQDGVWFIFACVAGWSSSNTGGMFRTGRLVCVQGVWLVGNPPQHRWDVQDGAWCICVCPSMGGVVFCRMLSLSLSVWLVGVSPTVGCSRRCVMYLCVWLVETPHSPNTGGMSRNNRGVFMCVFCLWKVP